ncbi:hypothetical protein J6590_027836 [Homalodisca vitripennis]|nr:hypothetical protein J6590_027836 [Homalodisca vitripennis]
MSQVRESVPVTRGEVMDRRGGVGPLRKRHSMGASAIFYHGRLYADWRGDHRGGVSRGGGQVIVKVMQVHSRTLPVAATDCTDQYFLQNLFALCASEFAEKKIDQENFS